MAITKEYARGTIIAVQAKATVSVGDPSLLEYSWFKDDVLQSTVQTGETATILVSAAGTYHVVVSHPNADSVRSDDFIVTLRDPKKILRLIYQTGSFANINSSTGDFTSFGVVDWNIAEDQYEFGPGQLDTDEFGTPASGWWRIFAKEQDLSLDITLRGSSGGSVGGNNKSSQNSGRGGVGTLRRTFEKSQLYSIRPGDRRSGANNDLQNNAPNGGRTFSGNGNTGGGSTYMKRGGTLIAVCGGGGGSATSATGGDGGGLNVAGESGQGNSRRGGRVVTPAGVNGSGYPRNYNTRVMTKCGILNGSFQCTLENSGNDSQNNGGFGDNGGGGGGSGVEGGFGGRSSNEGGCGGSGWASSAVTIVETQLGGNLLGRNGSVRIRETGFNNYQVQWYHVTQGLTPTFQYTNTGNFDAVVVPQNVGFETGEGPESSKHYFITFAEEYPDTNYNVNVTSISSITAEGKVQPAGSFIPTVFDKQKGSFRIKFVDNDGDSHIREVIFEVTPV